MNKKIIYYTLIVVIVAAGVFFGKKVFKNRKETTAPQNNVQETKKVANKDNTRVFFASDGKNSVYKIKKDDGWSVIWNGSEGKTYDFVSNPVFSADGSQLAYIAEIDGQFLVVVNNVQEINAYNGASNIVFSPDGTQITFVASKDDQYVIISAVISNIPSNTIENGTESQIYESVISISFNEESNLVYVVQDGDNVITIANGETVSTVPADSYVQNENFPDSDADLDINTNNDSDNSQTSPTSYTADYRYKPSTTKDIDREDNQSGYPTCVEDNCNF